MMFWLENRREKRIFVPPGNSFVGLTAPARRLQRRSEGAKCHYLLKRDWPGAENAWVDITKTIVNIAVVLGDVKGDEENQSHHKRD
jgi:hypothetical protein